MSTDMRRRGARIRIHADGRTMRHIPLVTLSYKQSYEWQPRKT